MTEASVTRAAGRVLTQMERFGYFDGRSKHTVTPHALEANAKVIERTAAEGAVLLKNDGGALPLKSADLDSVVLIGPTAAQVDAIGINGERSLGLPERQVSPLDALQRRAHVKIRFAVDDDMTGTPVPASDLRPNVNFTVRGGNALPANTPAPPGTAFSACRRAALIGCISKPSVPTPHSSSTASASA